MGEAVRRILGFETQGLTAIGLWVARRRYGVPEGAVTAAYGKNQAFMLTLMTFAMLVETVVVDLLLVAFEVDAWIRFVVLFADLYGVLFAVGLAAACATRPHVITASELRVRYGAYIDVRVPRELIASVRSSATYNENDMIAVKDGRLTVAVSSQANLTVELTEPITIVRPLGSRAEVTSVRFYADVPGEVMAALRSATTTPAES